MLAPDQRGEAGELAGTETIAAALGREQLPGVLGADALERHRAEIIAAKVVGDQAPRGIGDHHSARCRQLAQPRREVRRGAGDNRFGARPAVFLHADHDDTGGNPDANLERDARNGLEPAHRGRSEEGGPGRPLGIVVARRRVAEQEHQRIADHAIGEHPRACGRCLRVALVLVDDAPDGPERGSDRVAEVLWIEARRQLGVVDDVEVDHRGLALLDQRSLRDQSRRLGAAALGAEARAGIRRRTTGPAGAAPHRAAARAAESGSRCERMAALGALRGWHPPAPRLDWISTRRFSVLAATVDRTFAEAPQPSPLAASGRR